MFLVAGHCDGRVPTQNLLFQCFFIAQHVSGETAPIIRSSKTVIAASAFTKDFGCRPLRWLISQSAIAAAGNQKCTQNQRLQLQFLSS